MEAQALRSRARWASRRARRIQASEYYDDLMLLNELDRRGRVRGGAVCELDERSISSASWRSSWIVRERYQDGSLAKLDLSMTRFSRGQSNVVALSLAPQFHSRWNEDLIVFQV